MRRGRVLQSLAASTSSRDNETRRDGDRINPPIEQSSSVATPSTPSASGPQKTGRGGKILAALRAPRGDPSQTGHVSPPSVSPPVVEAQSQAIFHGELSSSTSGDRSRLSRQGSDLSNQSVLSQHFAMVEQDNYKATLPKEQSTFGQEISVSLNYMTFEINNDQRVEEYHVDFNPNIESIRLRYNLLRTETAKAIIGSVVHWTGTNLYLPIKLRQRVTEFQAIHPMTNQSVNVRLTYIKTPPDSELLPFYNSLMHKVMNKLKYVIINRQHYSPIHKISIEQHRLEVWPGWITAIQRLDGGLKLSIDASFRVLRLETVRDIMMDLRTRCSGMNLTEVFNQQLCGSIIMTRYNNKSYRIDEIVTDVKPTSTFLLDNGNREISYVDYLREHWNVTVKDLHQPMIVHRPKPRRGEETAPPVYLVPELCVTTGLTDQMRADYNIMKAIHDHTKLPPDVRESKLIEFLQQLATDERAKTVLSDWNLSVEPTLDVVKARRLEPETVVFGGGKYQVVPENADWTRGATNNPVFKTVDITSWVIMYTDRDSGVAEDFLNSLKEVSRQLGIKFQAPRIIKLPNDSTMTYVNYGKREVKVTDQMVVLITPGKGQREDRYSACKRLYSCDLPVPCQFIRAGTISNPRKLRSICQKVVIQILSKAGGQPWAIKIPMKRFMIIGIDVYHDTIDRKKSCVGVVASLNETTSQWWSHTFYQNSLEEINQKLTQTVLNAMKRFHAVNGVTPQKIIIYRDGVGDGQLDTVLNFEVVQVVNGIKFFMKDIHNDEPAPDISYVVVQKRINAKIALRDRGRIVNPLPGTYVDHTITHPEYNDFYLVSQHVNQGTVSPTKYIVLTETGTLKVPHHQKLAYKMTHMYYNWCGTIRVPAPCQYAHKLAYLSGQNIKQAVNPALSEKLYFL